MTPRRNVHCGSTINALSPGCAGVGFAIEDGFMGGRDIAEGALVHPFGPRTFAFCRYGLVAHPVERLSPTASAFAGWLRREAGAAILSDRPRVPWRTLRASFAR